MTTMTTTTDPSKVTRTTEAAAEAPAVIRGQKQSGVGVGTNHHPRRKNCSTRGCPRHTYLDKDGRQKPAHLLIECWEFLRLSQAL
jgi:hypothetical protein